jgi:hypothetical protein
MADNKKTLKLTPSKSGAKMYMSDAQKKKQRDRPKKGTDAEKRIDDTISAARDAKKMTPKESGTKKAKTFIDMTSRTYGNDTDKYATGGKVGSCRGMGAAAKGGGYNT